ncbi:MAG: serine/threonine protein kinase [Rhizobiaceae bacterium]|nr:serine/threonine protein kinase [Rhizobiaceae bacterium]
MSGVLQEGDLEAELARLDQDMANSRPKDELARRIAELTPAVAPHPVLKLRLLIAQGAVENRLTLSGKALATLYEARKLAAMKGAERYRARVSREIATVHSWRGKGEAAMRELLRSIAEAKVAGQPEDEAAAIAEAVRACKEIKDYELALVFLDAALALPATPLTRARTYLDRLQILNRDGQHDACLAQSDACMDAMEAVDSKRVRLLGRIERARALAGVGRFDEARAVLDAAEEMLSDDPGAYERIEWTEAGHEIAKLAERAGGQSPEQAETARQTLERLIEKFNADALHGQEADRRLELAELHYRHQRTEEALRQVSAVLGLGKLLDARVLERARNAMLVFCNSYDNSAAGLVQNRYVIGETLGSGGYGEVKRAYDVETGARRAVKFINLKGIGSARQRERLMADAKAEIEAASRARHPGIVRVHSVFVDGETIVVVQDFVEGQPLEMLKGEPLKLRTVVSLFREIADALVVLHHANVVHRDLKPANIIVDDVLQPTIVDFGLAAIAGAAEDKDASLRGTPKYIAPELLTLDSRPAPHPRQDVFALGVMLGEFLPPDARPMAFGLGSLFGMGTSLTRLVSGMRSRDPDRRPQDMRTVADALNHVAVELGAQSSDR